MKNETILTNLYKQYVLARKYAWQAYDRHGRDSEEYKKACAREHKRYVNFLEAQERGENQ